MMMKTIVKKIKLGKKIMKRIKKKKIKKKILNMKK